jgi:uncharacterized protein with LGFP repeats
VPRIVTRRQWGADPSLSNRCWAPRYGSSARMVFVHHTASSNRYSEREAPAVVRSIYAYHTQAEGWCDIGYNFLVDRYGNIYEGRRGGIRKPVRGSHAGDYNVNTVGISLIGNFTSAAPTSRMKKALVRLIAWRLGSSYRYAGGWTFVNGHRFRDISGHRDAMATSCPGQVVYDWLPTLRRRVAARMGNFKTPIYAKWQALGGIGGTLGAPFVGEQWLGPGRYTVFAHGRVYWTPDTGAHALSGRILTYFRRLGGVGSVLGYPTTDVRRAAGPGTARAKFAGGRLYWSRRTGAHEIYGAILKRYVRTGGAGAALGLPTTGPARVRVGWRQSFQGGRITRNSTTHRTTVRYR